MSDVTEAMKYFGIPIEEADPPETKLHKAMLQIARKHKRGIRRGELVGVFGSESILDRKLRALMEQNRIVRLRPGVYLPIPSGGRKRCTKST